MLLRRLELVNICQHRHLEWNFQTGLIGVFGPNGSGKTNALNVGCYAGLSGDYRRHHENQAGMICQRAEAKEVASITVDLDVGGGSVRLIRYIRRPKGKKDSHILQLSDGTEIVGADDVQKYLTGALGISKTILDSFVFVNQADLHRCITAGTAERDEALSQILGMQKFDAIRQGLRDASNRLSPMAFTDPSALSDLKEAIRKWREAVSGLIAERQALGYIPSDKELEAAKAKMIAASNYWTALTSFRSMRAETSLEPPSEEFIANLQSELERQSTRQAELRERRESLSQLISAVRHTRLYISRTAQLEERLVSAKEALQGAREVQASLLQNAPERVSESERMDLSAAEARADLLTRWLSSLESGAKGDEVECPLCGSMCGRAEEAVVSAQAELDELKVDIVRRRKALADKQSTSSQWEKKVADVSVDIDKHLANIDVLEQELAQNKESIDSLPDHDLDELNVKLAKLNRQLSEAAESISTISKELREAVSTRDRILGEISARTAQLERQKKLLHEMRENKVSSFSEVSELEAEFNRLSSLVTGARRIDDRLAYLDEMKEELFRRCLKVRSSLRKARSVRVKLGLLESALEVFGRDKFPRILKMSNLRRLQDQMNETLELFEAGFSVDVQDPLQFRATFADGTAVLGPGLSRGQQVMLALAYRVTLNEVFARHVGFMVLDEPTDGLDLDHRKALVAVLKRLSDNLKATNRQMVIITHDENLLGVFDQSLVCGGD